jgi:hypothetical protein
MNFAGGDQIRQQPVMFVRAMQGIILDIAIYIHQSSPKFVQQVGVTVYYNWSLIMGVAEFYA